MIVRELLTRIGYQVDRKTEKRVNQSFNRVQEGAKNTARRVAGFLGFGAVVLGFKSAIDAASGVEETLSAMNILFEDNAGTVRDWAAQFGEAAGRSEFQMREYATSIAKVVSSSLDNAKATSEMSTQIAEAAVDLASFNDATEEDTLTALRAGLIGSFEPLQRFGVVLNVAELEAFRLRKGLTKAYKDMSSGEKITLRYRAIMEQASNAMGDAERTSAGYANQVKRLEGNIHKLRVRIGKEFTPDAAEMLAKLNAIAKEIQGPLIRGIRALGNALRAVGIILRNFVEFFMESGTAMQAVLTSLILLVIAFLAPWLIVGALAAVAIGGIIVLLDDLWAGFTRGEGVMAGFVNELQFLADEHDSYATALRLSLQTAIDHWIWYFTGVENGAWRMGEAIRGTFRKIGNSVVEIGKTIADGIVKAVRVAINMIRGMGRSVVESFGAIGKIAGAWLGRIGAELGDIAGASGIVGPTNIAAPGSPAARRGGDVNSQQDININVNAPGGDGPTIAAAVAPAAGRAAAEGNRQTAQQLLLGGATP